MDNRSLAANHPMRKATHGWFTKHCESTAQIVNYVVTSADQTVQTISKRI